MLLSKDEPVISHAYIYSCGYYQGHILTISLQQGLEKSCFYQKMSLLYQVHMVVTRLKYHLYISTWTKNFFAF